MKISIILVLITLSGCAYPTKKESFIAQYPEKGMSVIYLYRSQTSIDSVNPDVPRFFVNDKAIGRLSIGGYYRVVVRPGKSIVTYKDSFFGIPFFWNSGKVEVMALENQSYFVKFGIESILRVEKFELIPDVVGRREIKKTKLLVN